MPEPYNPCPDCGQHVNERILASSPDCPHGWIDLVDMSLADVKAALADECPPDASCLGDGLSVDP